MHLRNLLVALLSVFISSPFLHTCFGEDLPIAEVYSLEGTATLRSTLKTDWSSLSVGQKLFPGDEIQVGANSRAALEFTSGYFVRLSSETRITLSSQSTDTVSMNSGKLHLFNRASDTPTIITPHVTAAIRGTEVDFETTSDLSKIEVIEGKVDAKNSFGEVELKDTEQAIVRPGSAPVKSVIISSKDAVQWTISVPQIVSAQGQNELISSSPPRIRAQISDAFEKLAGHDIDGAAVLFRSIVNSEERSKLSDSLQAELLSQESIFALARGDVDEAATLLKSTTLSNDQPSSALARSYVLQAKNQLEEGGKVITTALALSPDNALLLARAAEFALYSDNIDQADVYISKSCGSICTDPALITLQGFISLSKHNAKDALAQFNKSLAIDSAQSRAYFGLALAQARGGDLNSARTSLLKAIHLDPTLALYRSYLGKLAYEQQDSKGSYRELNEALRLDPLDPTPHLYRAYTLLGDNRPIEAVREVEASLEKNSNRGVFRSNALLDQDTAARTANLGEIFIEAGMSERGRITALEALAKDPLNASAHRLLGETQDQIFYADAALSEQRLAQILSPLSTNYTRSIGTSISFNTYESLLEQERTRGTLGYFYDGRDDTHVASTEVTGMSETTSGQLLVSSAYGDGLKKGNFSRDTLVSSAVEWTPTYSSKFLAELSGRFIDSKQVDSLDGNVETTTGSSRSASLSSL